MPSALSHREAAIVAVSPRRHPPQRRGVLSDRERSGAL